MNALLPFYYQIKQTIKDWIIHGEFSAGEKIPSEHELSKQFIVARLTVRQAISQLIQEGFLVRRRGIGTFVTDNRNFIKSLSVQSTGFLNEVFYQAHKAKAKSVTLTRTMAPQYIRGKLELGAEAQEVVQVKRVRYLGENSFSFTVNYLPLEIGSKVNEEELYKKPFLQVLEQDLGIHIAESFETVKASFADSEVAEELGIPSGSPILFVETVIYTKRRKPVQFVQASYRGDSYQYIVRLKYVKRKNGAIWVHPSGQV